MPEDVQKQTHQIKYIAASFACQMYYEQNTEKKTWAIYLIFHIYEQAISIHFIFK